MKLEDKQRILSYLQSHNDESEEAKALINLMKSEVNYADCDVFSVSIDDLLNSISEKSTQKLESYFGKPVEELTAEDLQEIADAMADNECDDFSGVLECAINYLE